ncbi:MAG: serine/threonine-protein kinase [Gemmatimonadales bacterium]
MSEAQRPAWVVDLQKALATRFRIEGELGRGNMGRVFLATDARSGARVAVKALPPELASAANAGRFVREIRIAGGLAHPNILPILESGNDGAVAWFAMPLLEGGSLRTRLAAGPLPLAEIAGFAGDVLDALGHAHERGIIHRDLKPENVMRAAADSPWVVLDFGLARALEGETRITGLNMPLGTPAYMSPEQISGAATVDARADIYGFGCVLYEAVTGRPPFGGRTVVDLLRAQLTTDPPPPSQARAEVPRALDPVVLKALAKQADQRYPTVAALRTDCLAALGSLAGPAAAPPATGWLARLFGRSAR